MNRITPFEMSFQIQPKQGDRLTAAEVGYTPYLGRLPRITQVLALAIQLEYTIRNGEAKDYADIARLGGLSRERVSQIIRLIYLAPDIQVELLYLPPTPTGRYPISETAVRKIANLLSWACQRQEWARLKVIHHLSE
jgi:hypothetical protein